VEEEGPYTLITIHTHTHTEQERPRGKREKKQEEKRKHESHIIKVGKSSPIGIGILYSYRKTEHNILSGNLISNNKSAAFS